jgi:hypothetical protein
MSLEKICSFLKKAEKQKISMNQGFFRQTMDERLQDLPALEITLKRYRTKLRQKHGEFENDFHIRKQGKRRICQTSFTI